MAQLSPSVVSDEIAAFLEQGLSFLVATCDRDLSPECMRAVGLTLHSERTRATVYLPEVTGRRTLQNLQVRPRVAVLASYPLDHRSLQLKGAVTSEALAEPAALDEIERYLDKFVPVLEAVGMPAELVRQVSHWPAIAVTFELEELYVQTPGPGAGARLTGHAL